MTTARYTLERPSKSELKKLLPGTADIADVFREIEKALSAYLAAQEMILAKPKKDRKREKQYQVRELKYLLKRLTDFSKAESNLNEACLNRIWRYAGRQVNMDSKSHKTNLKTGQEKWRGFLQEVSNWQKPLRSCIERTEKKPYKTGERELKKLAKSLATTWNTRAAPDSNSNRKKFHKFLRVITDDFNGQSAKCQLNWKKVRNTWQDMEHPESEDASDEELEI